MKDDCLDVFTGSHSLQEKCLIFALGPPTVAQPLEPGAGLLGCEHDIQPLQPSVTFHPENPFDITFHEIVQL